jgi:hypothetical protein
VGNIVFDWVRPRTLNAGMMKRDMAPDDLCGTAAFLASDASAFVMLWPRRCLPTGLKFAAA